jgi:hypothetical protein
MFQEELENLGYASDIVQDAWKRILCKTCWESTNGRIHDATDLRNRKLTSPSVMIGRVWKATPGDQ